jgi:hypothetical protein
MEQTRVSAGVHPGFDRLARRRVLVDQPDIGQGEPSERLPLGTRGVSSQARPCR